MSAPKADDAPDVSDRASYEWVRTPWWRRWLARLLALVALAGVAYAVVTIVRDGTGPEPGTASAVAPALAKLSKAQERLAVTLDALKPGRSASVAKAALRRVQADRQAVVAALRQSQAGRQKVDDATTLQDALGAEFDYLDAVDAVLHSPRSKLLKGLGNRAEKAKTAFTNLADSAGVQDGIRGTTALTAWARARRG